jgi:hypothetical protein
MNLVRRLTTIAGALAWPSICMVIGAVMFVVGFGGTRVDLVDTQFGYSEGWEHGWPMPFLGRSVDHASSRFQFTDREYCIFRWGPFVLDALIFISIVGAVVLVPYLIAARQRIERKGMAFSLSTLFVIVTFCCLLLGNMGRSLSIARREQSIATQLQQTGHGYDRNKYIGPLWLARLNGDLTDDRLKAFHGVRSVLLVLEKEPDFDRLAAAVRSLQNLDELRCSDQSLSDKRLTDRRLLALLTQSQRSRLDSIDFFQTEVTGSAFVEAQDWSRLFSVNLRYSRLDDTGFENLAKIPSIYSLNVSGTLITKKSLIYAAKMPKLRQFYAKHCGFTQPDVAELTAHGVTCSID